LEGKNEEGGKIRRSRMKMKKGSERRYEKRCKKVREITSEGSASGDHQIVHSR
jgi:hypothetical protein